MLGRRRVNAWFDPAHAGILQEGNCPPHVWCEAGVDSSETLPLASGAIARTTLWPVAVADGWLALIAILPADTLRLTVLFVLPVGAIGG